MQPGITNIYVTTSDCSTLVVESTSLFSYSINKTSRYIYEIIVDGRLIMAPDAIKVFDGLINTVTVVEQYNRTFISVGLEYPSPYRIKIQRGIPERLVVCFDWSFIKKILKDKVIVIDPGHGGIDVGYRGHINLLEKNVVLHMANYLKQRLNAFGAQSIMTREKDVRLRMSDRIQTATLLEANLFISIHTNWNVDKNINGACGAYRGEKGQKLCEVIIEELGRKLRLENLGIRDESDLNEIPKNHYISQIPYVNIEVCTISNPVEEGWLRSPVFKERVATAIMNGIVKYLVHTNRYTTV